MFILYAILVGIAAGLVGGGSLARLGNLRLAWTPLILGGMTGQVALFSTPIGDWLGPVAATAYVLSNVAVLVAVWHNRQVPGLRVVLAGGAANLAAILANGGYMPASPAALASLGWLPGEGYSNSRLVDVVALGPLTDLFAMPSWLPLANIFSVGDVLIGIGAAIAVAAAMRGRDVVDPRSPGPAARRPSGSPGGGTSPAAVHPGN